MSNSNVFSPIWSHSISSDGVTGRSYFPKLRFRPIMTVLCSNQGEVLARHWFQFILGRKYSVLLLLRHFNWKRQLRMTPHFAPGLHTINHVQVEPTSYLMRMANALADMIRAATSKPNMKFRMESMDSASLRLRAIEYLIDVISK